MPDVVGIRFRPCTKMYHFAPGDLTDLRVAEPVIVETAQGQELGWVVAPPAPLEEEALKGKLRTVVRRAPPVDLVTMEAHRSKEPAALSRCREKVAEMGLPMKVVRADYVFNGERLVFSFVAEERVDFRELVRQLARTFRTRIEMRQIGARDEARLIGGYAQCGRELCCASWLVEFHPVSIKMAKQQDLPLTPTEISGMCGRLLCCLAYENAHYIDVKQSMPSVGTQVATPQGKGTITGLNVLTEMVTVELQSELTVEVLGSDVTPLAEQKRAPKARGKSTE